MRKIDDLIGISDESDEISYVSLVRKMEKMSELIYICVCREDMM
jgi:hypothetical protein